MFSITVCILPDQQLIRLRAHSAELKLPGWAGLGWWLDKQYGLVFTVSAGLSGWLAGAASQWLAPAIAEQLPAQPALISSTEQVSISRDAHIAIAA